MPSDWWYVLVLVSAKQPNCELCTLKKSGVVHTYYAVRLNTLIGAQLQKIAPGRDLEAQRHTGWGASHTLFTAVHTCLANDALVLHTYSSKQQHISILLLCARRVCVCVYLYYCTTKAAQHCEIQYVVERKDSSKLFPWSSCWNHDQTDPFFPSSAYYWPGKCAVQLLTAVIWFSLLRSKLLSYIQHMKLQQQSKKQKRGKELAESKSPKRSLFDADKNDEH